MFEMDFISENRKNKYKSGLFLILKETIRSRSAVVLK